MLVYTTSPPDTRVPAVRSVIQSVDKSIPVGDVLTLQGTFSTSAHYLQGIWAFVGACGGLAMLLASLGIYGPSRTR